MNIENLVVETLNLHELAQLFRNVGISTSETKLADGIEQGKYPFAICIQQKGRQFEIYKRLVIDWLTERGVEIDPPIVEE
jgi:hypothetical protein